MAILFGSSQKGGLTLLFVSSSFSTSLYFCGRTFSLIDRCGVVTVEIEHVDAITLEKLEQQGIDCQPKASTIRIIQVSVHFSICRYPVPIVN